LQNIEVFYLYTSRKESIRDNYQILSLNKIREVLGDSLLKGVFRGSRLNYIGYESIGSTGLYLTYRNKYI